MTDDEIAALRQKTREWLADKATAPAPLLALYENIVDVCLQMTMQGSFLPAGEVVEG
jgi:hypothetical protein